MYNTDLTFASPTSPIKLGVLSCPEFPSESVDMQRLKDDGTYWIESCGEDAFLYRLPVTAQDVEISFSGTLCVGSMTYPLKTWVVFVNTPLDEQLAVVSGLSREESLDALWEARHRAI